MGDLAIRCVCGQLELTATGVHPGVASRLVCECQGCRAFAARMGHPEILDDEGGTERFLVSPASLTLSRGAERLGCIQQTPGGALRWYATCCDSPLVLTLPRAGIPFVGIDVARLVPPSTELLGPIRARVNSRLRGARARERGAGLSSLLRMLVHLAPLTLRWWMRGDQRRSSFFDAQTGRPVLEPERLFPARSPARAGGCR